MRKVKSLRIKASTFGKLKKAKSILKAICSPEILVILLVSLIYTSGIGIWALNASSHSLFYIYGLSFNEEDGTRLIELYVKVNRGVIELKQFFVDDFAVSWMADNRVVWEGESIRCVLFYSWKMGNSYKIKLVTMDDKSAELITKAPIWMPTLELDLEDINVITESEKLKINVNCRVSSNWTDSLHLVMFTYSSFEKSNRTIYIFYDQHFMTNQSLRRAETILNYFSSYGITIEKADYAAIEELSRAMPKIMLILVNPLKDQNGRFLEDAAPSPLIDPNGNGLIKDDSKYGKSFLYDWMRDNGLILVTVGSLQPYKRILYADGSHRYSADSWMPFDSHLILTDASGGDNIINGSFIIGEYAATRISGTLGLAYRESAFGFDKDSMENHGLQYYAYGDYKLPYSTGYLNLVIPIFIRVGQGGWLSMGDAEYWLKDEELAHDLFMIYLQAVWCSKWVPYGWYWDNGAKFFSNHRTFPLKFSIETEWMPLNILGDRLIIRVVAIAHSSEINKGVIYEDIQSIELKH